MIKTQQIKQIFKDKLAKKEFNEQGLIEIIGVSFIADKPSIFGTVNEDYIKKEIMWYNSKSRNVNDMYNPPKIWKDIATPCGKINSNYGWCIFSEDNYRQYSKAVKHLKNNPFTRQATMIYTRPTMHEDCSKDGMKDFLCTNVVSYMYRRGKLNCIVQMRSNDIVFGYKNDFAWQDYILSKLCKDLNMEKGDIHWQVSSLHCYPRHFKLIK